MNISLNVNIHRLVLREHLEVIAGVILASTNQANLSVIVAACPPAIEVVDNYCYLTIKDNGIEIEADKIDHIFDMFNTLDKVDRFNNTGTGIGLSTVKNLVERIEGTISVASTIGEGTVFTIKFKP